jgi:putative PEP-CTERM system histidine kinase
MTVQSLLAFSSAAMSGGLALFGLWAAPRAFVHRVFAAGMAVLAAMQICAGMSAQALLPADVRYWEQLRFWAAALVPGTWLLFSLSYARANYVDHIKGWRWGLVAAFTLPLGVAIGFSHALLMADVGGEMPGRWTVSLAWSGYVFEAMSLCAAIAVLSHLEKTLRGSAGSMRLQIKVMLLGLGSVFAVEIYTHSQTLLDGALQSSLVVVTTSAILVASVFMFAALIRHRLLHVEIALSRTLLYNSITVLGAGTYLIGVGGVAKVVRYIGGSQTLPLGAAVVLLALMGLSAALLSDQLRHEIKQFLNRHIYRSHYDYRREWTICTQRMTSVVQVDDLCQVVSRMVSDTFGVPSVTVWLLDEEAQERLLLGGSTVFWNIRGLPEGWEETARALITCMRLQTLPIDFAGPTAEGLSPAQREGLQAAKIRYGIALVARQQLLGVITLSGRLTQEPFSDEDFELMKTMADQAAASLLNLQLSRRLLRAKEMEAFQTVSTFFVHDLKNLAAKLSLMIQNLPVHYDNPAFRDDMLQVISKSVGKMNAMCSRLTLLTTHIDLNLVETDLNELVDSTLSELDSIGAVAVTRHLQPLPQVLADAEQLRKVLRNLLLNAIEAVGRAGEIGVTTERSGRWVVLTVRDDGCGMSSEFLTRSLFEPFQTTKSQGLGIGMFHSKMIVEAHRGRITADSVEGQGSTFRVWLPLVSSLFDDQNAPVEAVERPREAAVL